MGIPTAVPFLLLSVAALLLPSAAALFSFSYNFTATSDSPPPSGISFQGDAFFNKVIRLTRDERVGPIISSAGRAFFSRPIPLSDPVSRRPASFASAFSFSIAAPDPSAASGDGLAFFLSPFPSALPIRSAGGLLGLFNSSARGGGGGRPIVAVAFNAKLGDFGLAKLVEHGSQPYTTVLAGTLGYLAPECVMTGKASRESDVYSFGVVALEIACGRRPAELNEEPSKARLVPWVWELYGKKALLQAADWRLKGEFDERQVEHLMTVGLWCAHPDYTLIDQASGKFSMF